MNNENQKIIGYDPQTGQPIYEIQNQIQENNNIYQQPQNINTQNVSYQNVVQTSSINKNNKGSNKILIITNIITAILLIIFIVAFILKNPNCESFEPAEKIEEEKNNYNSTATTNPVSKDWKDYQFSIDGKTLALPCSYMEFKDISGFAMKSSDEKSYLERNSSTYVNLYIGDKDNQKLALYIDIKNDTLDDLQYSEAEIVRLWQTKYQVETNNASEITFPGDLKVGMEISKDQIIELFGEPTKIRDNSSEAYGSITLTYNGDETYTTINYYEIEIMNGKIDSLTLDHKKNKE